MQSLHEMRKRILELAEPIEAIEVPLSEAAGLVLAEPQYADVDIPAFDREQFADWYKAAFRASLKDANRTGLRLQFEAGALEPVDPDIGKRITTSFTEWRGTVKSWVKNQGVETRRAGVLAHWLVDTAAGLHFGFLLSGDRTATVQAFDVFLDAFLREVYGA